MCICLFHCLFSSFSLSLSVCLIRCFPMIAVVNAQLFRACHAGVAPSIRFWFSFRKPSVHTEFGYHFAHWGGEILWGIHGPILHPKPTKASRVPRGHGSDTDFNRQLFYFRGIVSVHLSVWTSLSVCVCVCVCMCARVCMHACMCACLPVCVCVFAQLHPSECCSVRVCDFVHIYRHMYIHIFMYRMLQNDAWSFGWIQLERMKDRYYLWYQQDRGWCASFHWSFFSQHHFILLFSLH